MLLFLILFLLVFFLFWVLFIPIKIVINTDKEQFYIQQSGTFKFSFKLDEIELVFMRIRIFFISFNLYPIRSILNESKPSNKKKKKKKRQNLSIRTIHLLFKIIKSNLSTYKMKKLILNIDTGSVVTNAWLFPIGEVISGKEIRLSINNSNDFRLLVLIENTLYMMVVATIKSLIKHHIYKK